MQPPRFRRHARRAIAAALVVSGTSSSAALATDRHWNVAGGDWNLASNWEPDGVPGSSDNALLDFFNAAPATATVSSNVGSPASVQLRNGDTVNVTTHGEIHTGGLIVVGEQDTSGTMVFPDAGIVSAGDLRLGVAGGSGQVDQMAGSMAVNGMARLGDSRSMTSRGAGTYSISGGSLNAATIALGGDDSGPYDTRATLNISAFASVNANTLFMAGKTNGDAATNQSGGTLTISELRMISFDDPGVSRRSVYNLTGGSLVATRIAEVGAGNQLNWTGGSAQVAQVDLTGGQITVAPGLGRILETRILRLQDQGSSLGQIDLADNPMIETGSGGVGNSAVVASYIAQARHGGAWDGGGITSGSARSNPLHDTTLGVLTGIEFHQLYGNAAAFHGTSIFVGYNLIDYTYYGDTDFNHVVNFDDYVRADNGFNNHLTGWLNGDFDLNGVVNFDDYVLIDLAFNTQSGTLGRALSYLAGADRNADTMRQAALREVEQHFQRFGQIYADHFLAAVPESAPYWLIVAALGAANRRLRR